MDFSRQHEKKALTGELASRHKVEEEFHDTKARDGVHDFYEYGALSLADSFLFSSLGNLRGKRLLEIGCGDGEATVRFAKAGAFITAIDISGGMVELTKKKVHEADLDANVVARQMGGEDLDLEQGYFDIVYGHSILHHLNLDIATPKIARALKKGGTAAFLEPLDYNPILAFFRLLTPHRRTPTEKPLKFSQFKSMAQQFSNWEHKEFYLFSLGAFFWYYVIRNRSLFQLTLRTLAGFDRLVFKMIPYFRKYAWVTVVRYIR
ncbi:MAG TPA: class I SAM-dependent methyltransferase [Bacteroidota bacterium]|nr:class I SAM-dependent methyltransferase [Bacteroidota bacterium]